MAKVVAHDVPQWILNWINMPDYQAIPPEKEAKLREKLESGSTISLISAITEIFNLPMKPQEHIDYYLQQAQQQQ